MVDGFFSEVPERIRVRWPGLHRPADVQGLRARPCWSLASGWRTTSGSASACGTRSLGRPRHVRDRDARPALARPGRRPDAGRPPEDGVAFEFIEKLGTPYYCFHDRDVAPEGASFAEFRDNLDALTDDALGYQSRTGATLLWGTANLFTHPRYQGGAATNPDPEVFAYAAAQVKHMLEVTQRLGGTNYVLWGGREGYDTLLNTDLKREGDQLARFLHLVAEHKHRIGFEGTLLIEPKPMEPTKHQYDYDSATIHGFLVRNGLEDEYRLNIEANHATLAGHSFHHEVAYAVANGMLGSIDANRGDPQNGWDTDQFPNSVEDLVLPIYEILKGGGFTTGGFNFDAKLRRQSTDRTDLFHAHIGGIDTLARALARRGRPAGERDPRAAARGALRGLGRSARPGDPRRSAIARVTRGEGRVGRDRPDSRCRATRSSSRASSTSASGPPSANRSRRAPAADRGARPRDRRLDDRDEGRPRRRAGCRPRGRHIGVRVPGPAPALERAGSWPVVDRGGLGDRLGHGLDRDDRGGHRRHRTHGTDAWRSSCSTEMVVSSGPRSSGTTSGPPRNATRSAWRSGQNGSSPSPATTR